MPKIERALLSVTDKTGVVDLAKQLHEHGIELISTGGTAKLIADAGIPVKEVADVTGFPEILDGRVKTIHPRVAGGVLAIRANEEHMAALREHGIPRIDLVVVNLYAFEKYANKPGVTREELIEVVRRVMSPNYKQHETDFWLRLLKVNLPGVPISDLIFWPDEVLDESEASEELSPERIVEIALARWPSEGHTDAG